MYGTIATKLIVGMLGVIFFLRISGKTQMAQLTPLDSVNAFVIGALVGGVIYNPDMDVWHLIFALAVWTSFNMLMRYSLRFRWMRKLIKGDSVYAVRNGIINMKVLRRNGLEMEQFRTLLRQKDIFSMFDVDDVRFETNGQLTVSKRGETGESFLLVNNGHVLTSSLVNANRTCEWLEDKLKNLGYENISLLFCVEWTPHKGFYIVKKDGVIQNGDECLTCNCIDEDISA